MKYNTSVKKLCTECTLEKRQLDITRKTKGVLTFPFLILEDFMKRVQKSTEQEEEK